MSVKYYKNRIKKKGCMWFEPILDIFMTAVCTVCIISKPLISRILLRMNVNWWMTDTGLNSIAEKAGPWLASTDGCSRCDITNWSVKSHWEVFFSFCCHCVRVHQFACYVLQERVQPCRSAPVFPHRAANAHICLKYHTTASRYWQQFHTDVSW